MRMRTVFYFIDYFGGGTEPQIGGAIAEALLDRFNQKHAYAVSRPTIQTFNTLPKIQKES